MNDNSASSKKNVNVDVTVSANMAEVKMGMTNTQKFMEFLE